MERDLLIQEISGLNQSEYESPVVLNDFGEVGGNRIVNKKDLVNADKTNIVWNGVKGVEVHRLANQAWEKLIAKAKADGIDPRYLRVNSGYRSSKKQKSLWDAALLKYGNASEARKWVAMPGGSAHQSGRALDFNLGIKNSSTNARSGKFLKIPAYQWLKENAPKFGFYPYEREPWHWEYNPPANFKGINLSATTATSHPISNAVQAAVSYNSANYTKWQPHEYDIYRQLGFTNSTPNPAIFAEALMKWQSQNRLTSDGKLGPQSLAKFVSGSSAGGGGQQSLVTVANTTNLKIESNRKYAKSLGWGQYLYNINNLLLPFSGQSNVSLSEEGFISALIKWQSANGLLNDGVMGPRTWLKMQSQLKLSQTPSSSSTNPIAYGASGANSAIPTLGKLQVDTNQPGLSKSIPMYQFTSDDALWLARFVEGEAGGKNTLENHAVIYAVFNRYGAFRHLPAAQGWGSFGSFIRKYSTTLQAMLNSVGAARRVWKNHTDNPEKNPIVRGIGTYKGTTIQKVQYLKHIKLQQKSWNSFSHEVQNLIVNILTGKIPNPGIGMASDFASTNVYFKDHNDRYPSDPEWITYTLKYAKDKNKIWVGQIAGINQKKNAFFIDNRLKAARPNSIKVV